MSGEADSLPSLRERGGLPPVARAEPAVRLMSKPQRFGILPSLRFWREIRRTNSGLHLFVTLAWAVLVMPPVLCAAVVAPSWVSTVMLFSSGYLGMGCIERILRKEITRRRRLAVAGEPEAAGPRLDDSKERRASSMRVGPTCWPGATGSGGRSSGPSRSARP